MNHAPLGLVASNALEDLQVYQNALAEADEISAITDRPSFRHDPELRQQLRDASARVPALISEGHGQKTDRHFAHYLYVARGTCKEVRAHLSVARGRAHITEAERSQRWERYEEIARMLTGLIRHLENEDRKFRP
jgi:four helix bundle protein